VRQRSNNSLHLVSRTRALARGRLSTCQGVHPPSNPCTHRLPLYYCFPLECGTLESRRESAAGLRLGNGWLLFRRYQLHSAPEAEVALTHSLVQYAAIFRPRARPATCSYRTDNSHSTQLYVPWCAPRLRPPTRSFTALPPQSHPHPHRSPMSRALRIRHCRHIREP
jgi:hypothetical protein